MGKKEKLINRLLNIPKDFTFDELNSLLEYFGFEQERGGKTSGSAVKYKNLKSGTRIYLHKPHPGNIVKRYILVDVIDELKKEGFLNEK